METHLNTSWKIAEVKLWVLAKFLPTVFTSVPFLPRALSSQKRAVSPIRFASRQQLRVNKASRSVDAYYLEDDYDEDEDDLEDDVYDKYKYRVGTRPSTSSSATDPPKLSVAGDPTTHSSCDPTTYTLLSFTTGQVLEDHYTLAWYNIQSHELLELHISPFVINLPRSIADDYIQPYFEARVWALRAVHRHFDSRTETAPRWADLDGKHSDGEDPTRREKLRKRKTKLEWRERWITIHQGVFSLCRHRNDPKPSHTSPLSALLAIRGSDHLQSTGASIVSPVSGVPSPGLHSTSFAYVHSSHGHHQSHLQTPRDASRTVVCAKFRTEKKPSRRKADVIIDPPSVPPHVSLSRTSTATGMAWGSPPGSSSWWKKGMKDHHIRSTHGSANNSAHSSAPSSGTESKQPGLESFNTLVDDHHSSRRSNFASHEPRVFNEHWEDIAEMTQEDGFWIVLDLLDQPSFQNFLRLLHRHAPPATPTSFISEPRVTASPPPSRVPSRSSSPISFTCPSPSTIGSRSSSRPASSLGSATTIRGDDAPSDPVHCPFDLPGIPEGVGATYPDWRLNVTKKARKAGLGDVGRAMEWAMFGSLEVENDKKERRGRSPVRHGLGNAAATTELHLQGTMSDEESDGSQESEPQSSLEWEGWIEDVRSRWKFAKESGREFAPPHVHDESHHRRRDADFDEIHWDPHYNLCIPISRATSPPNAARSDYLLSPEPHHRPPRSLNSYASADSLLKKAIKRLESRNFSPRPESRPRSPSTELDEEGEADEDDRGAYGIEIAVDDDEEQHSSSAASSLITSHLTYPTPHGHSHHRDDDYHGRHSHSNDGHGPRGAPISMAMTTITSTVTVGESPRVVEPPPKKTRPRRRSNTVGLSPASATSFGKFAVKMKRSGDSLHSSNSHASSAHGKGGGSEAHHHGKHDHHKQGHGLFNLQPGKLKLSLPTFSQGQGQSSRHRSSQAYHSQTYRQPSEHGHTHPPSAFRYPTPDAPTPMPMLTPVSPSVPEMLSPNTASPLSPFESPTFAHPDDSD